MAACASILTGATMAMPAATFADQAVDPPPIARIDLGGSTVAVPDPGVPLPDVEVDTEQLPLAAVTEALGVALAVDTAPEAADTAPERADTAPETADTAPEAPDPAPTTREPTTREPSDAPADEVRTMSHPTSISEVPAAETRGRSIPASAVAAPAPSRPTTTDPAASGGVTSGVLDTGTQRQIEQRAAVRAANVLGTEKSTVAKDGLALAAPLTDLGPRAGDTLNLASRNGPNSSSGDWNLMPEALYAVLPLVLAGAAVVVHGRRNARVTATSAGVVQRRRHASTK